MRAHVRVRLCVFVCEYLCEGGTSSRLLPHTTEMCIVQASPTAVYVCVLVFVCVCVCVCVCVFVCV